MAIISLPTSFRPVGFSFGQRRYDTMERSDSTGAEAARLLAPPRWTCSVQSADHMTLSEAGQWEAWCLKLRGGVNVAAIYDPVRTQPEGTLRGSPVVGVAVAAGATSVTIGGAVGTNLLRFHSSYNNAYWTRTRSTVTSNATTASDGTTSADKLVEDSSASATHYLNSSNVSVSAGVLPTMGVEVKAGERTQVNIQCIRDAGSAASSGCHVDLSSGTITSGPGTIVSLGSGWYAVYLTATTAATTGVYSLRVWLESGGTNTYTGDGASGIYVARAWISESAQSSYPPLPTLKAGDQLQIGTGVGTSQLVKIVDDATATEFAEAVWQTGGGAQAIWSTTGGQVTWSDDGSPGESMTVTFEPPLRTAFAKDTAVTWDKPVAYYRMQGYPKWQYSQRAYRREGGFAADFVETFN
jgi:hypothetical protein